MQDLVSQGRVEVYTDWSAMQARYGVFYGKMSERNFAALVPVLERQSVSLGELRGLLHALL